jgi:hypothetical protein
MSRKNLDLCERSWCRKRWTHLVSGHQAHWKSGWTLRVCEDHVKQYSVVPDGQECGGLIATIERRAMKTEAVQ